MFEATRSMEFSARLVARLLSLVLLMSGVGCTVAVSRDCAKLQTPGGSLIVNRSQGVSWEPVQVYHLRSACDSGDAKSCKKLEALRGEYPLCLENTTNQSQEPDQI